MMKTFFICCLMTTASLLGGTVRIMNDSPFPLNAEVISADGQSKGKLFLNPQQQLTWQDPPSSGNNVWSQTPYTVIFTCKDGKQFGVSSGIQQGGLVMALSSSGDRYCQPDKKQDSQSKSPSQQNTPFDAQTSPFQGDSPGSVGPADPNNAPGDPIWGPPSS
jgi:hypothetical protein